MANWAWPHTPSSFLARLLLVGGPFDGEEAAFAPPDTATPVQIVWGGWMPWGFDAWLYEWHGETRVDQGRTDALIYRATGRRLGPDEIPATVADDAELWAKGAAQIVGAFDVPPELIWPGV